MKFADIVANALEICDDIANPTVGAFPNSTIRWHDDYVKDFRRRRNKIRNWYLSRLIRRVA